MQSLNGNSNGIIKLSASKNNLGKPSLLVTDNGPGISPILLDQIFIPFFTTKKQGTGIGLSLTKHIMRLHGGNINVNSLINTQTVFKIEF